MHISDVVFFKDTLERLLFVKWKEFAIVATANAQLHKGNVSVTFY